jgi:hypothetical protein
MMNMDSTTGSRELAAFRTLAHHWATIRDDLGLRRSCCVHASMAAALALTTTGSGRTHGVVCRTWLWSPSTNRFVEYGDVDGGLHAMKTEGPGYDHHAIVVGQDGFCDLTFDSHELGTPMMAAWENVSFDAKIVGELAPEAPEGDAWSTLGRAPRSPKPGGGKQVVGVWQILPGTLRVKPDNIATVQAIAARFAELL